MFDERPKFVPVEGAAEFAVMTFLAIARVQRAESEMDRGVACLLADVQAARAVTTFAADVHQLGRAEFAAIAGRAAEADGVAADALGVGIGLATDQRRESVRVGGCLPDCAAPGWQARHWSVPT